MLEIRKTKKEDLKEIDRIFNCAKKTMRDMGNYTQWNDAWPGLSLVEKDMEKGNSYVVLDNDKVVGTFACVPGIEPTYIEIDGKWLNDDPYVTIHRIASDGSVKGVFDKAIEYAKSLGKDIRIDTHWDNSIMLHLIPKAGFEKCGIITIEDGTERLAFQWINK